MNRQSDNVDLIITPRVGPERMSLPTCTHTGHGHVLMSASSVTRPGQQEALKIVCNILTIHPRAV